MENNLDTLQEDEVIIEDIDVAALETLDETLEQDITEAKAKKEDCDCDDECKCNYDEDEMGEDEMGEATKVDPKSIDGKDDDDKEDDGEGLDKTGDEDSDVDNDGDSDEADEYLTKRRKTVAKKLAKEEAELDEENDIGLAEASMAHGTERWRAHYPGVYSGTGYTKYFKDEASAKAWAAKKGHGTEVSKVTDVSKKDHDEIIKKGKEEMQKSGKYHAFIQHGGDIHTVVKGKDGKVDREHEGSYVRESLEESEDMQLDEARHNDPHSPAWGDYGKSIDEKIKRSHEKIAEYQEKIKEVEKKIASYRTKDGVFANLPQGIGNEIVELRDMIKRRQARIKKLEKEKASMKESYESEDLQLDEAISPELKELIDDFIAVASDARSDGDASEVLAKIKKHPGGEKIAKDLEDGWDKMYFGRANKDDGKGDSLARAKGRVTKAGKLNKTDAAKLKSIIKAKYGMKESYESEDITRLIESEEGLTEEFKDKAAIIFEAAVSSKVNEIEATLSEQYETRLAEEVESVKSVLEEQVDSYLTYAVESWMEENKVAIESSLRTQLAENFISSLKNVFVENYVDVPDSKVDLFAQLETENSNLKEQTAKLNRIAESLADRVDTLVREQIVTEASAGLADTQVDRLKKLVEDVEFVDEATYRKKVATIKEFYLNSAQETEDTTLTEDADDSFVSTETIVEGESMDDNLSPEMKSYLTALSRMNKAVTSDLL